jgi:hypothetical protein
MRISVIAVTFFFALMTQIRATTIVAVWTPTVVTLGADSREGDQTKGYSVCKITFSNNAFWTWSGVSKYSQNNFSFDEIISTTVDIPGSLDARISALERMLIPQLVAVTNSVRVREPNWKEGEDIISIIFGDAEDRILHIHAVGFSPLTDQAGNVSIKVRRFDCPSASCQGMAYFALGQHKIIDDEISRNSSIWNQLGVQGAIRHFIEAQIAGLPNHVAPPIAIAEITQGGLRWIDKGVCAPP